MKSNQYTNYLVLSTIISGTFLCLTLKMWIVYTKQYVLNLTLKTTKSINIHTHTTTIAKNTNPQRLFRIKLVNIQMFIFRSKEEKKRRKKEKTCDENSYLSSSPILLTGNFRSIESTSERVLFIPLFRLTY